MSNPAHIVLMQSGLSSSGVPCTAEASCGTALSETTAEPLNATLSRAGKAAWPPPKRVTVDDILSEFKLPDEEEEEAQVRPRPFPHQEVGWTSFGDPHFPLCAAARRGIHKGLLAR